MNNINLTGRLTYDPELKTTSNGTNYARFKIAVSRIGVKEGQQKTDFIPCIAWNKTAEILCKYCKMGAMVGVNGRLTANEYEKEGERKVSFEVVALSLEMLGGKSENKPQEEAKAPAPAAPKTSIDTNTDDYIGDTINLPFEL